MKIIRLQAENLKKIKAVDITPAEHVVVVGGRNRQGKSSVLDAITYAMGGKGTQCARPVRDGTNKATIVCTLEDLVVRRTITPTGGGTLTVSAADGASYKSPQAILDKLIGNLTFDPLAFLRLKPREQAEAMRSFVGVDTTTLDAERAEVYAKRTDTNAQAKACHAKALSCHAEDMLDGEPVSVAELTADLQDINAENEKVRSAHAKVGAAEVACNKARADLALAEAKLRAAQQGMKDAEARASQADKNLDTIKQAVATLVEADTGPILEQLKGAEEHNRKVAARLARERLLVELAELEDRALAQTTRITEIDQEKERMIAEADFPVPGLAFGDEGLMFNGVPFAQASSAEQLRVSVAMGIAQNPDLRVLLIRDGSLLDSDSMDAIAKMATEADYQVWVERVGEGDASAVVIEDGLVKGVDDEE
jgi:hypothetical protein